MEKLKYIIFGSLLCYLFIIIFLMINSYHVASHTTSVEMELIKEKYDIYNKKFNEVKKDKLNKNGLECYNTIKKYTDASYNTLVNNYYYKSTLIDNSYNGVELYNKCVKSNNNISESNKEAFISYVDLNMIADEPLFEYYYLGYRFKFIDYSIDENNTRLYSPYYTFKKTGEYGFATLLLDYLEYKEVENE